MVDNISDGFYFHSSEFRTGHRNVEDRLGLCSVETNKHVSVATEFPAPDLFKTYFVYFPLYSIGLLSQRILIDGNQLLICQDFHGGVWHIFQSTADHERRLEGCP